MSTVFNRRKKTIRKLKKTLGAGWESEYRKLFGEKRGNRNRKKYHQL